MRSLKCDLDAFGPHVVVCDKEGCTKKPTPDDDWDVVFWRFDGHSIATPLRFISAAHRLWPPYVAFHIRGTTHAERMHKFDSEEMIKTIADIRKAEYQKQQEVAATKDPHALRMEHLGKVLEKRGYTL